VLFGKIVVRLEQKDVCQKNKAERGGTSKPSGLTCGIKEGKFKMGQNSSRPAT